VVCCPNPYSESRWAAGPSPARPSGRTQGLWGGLATPYHLPSSPPNDGRPSNKGDTPPSWRTFALGAVRPNYQGRLATSRPRDPAVTLQMEKMRALGLPLPPTTVPATRSTTATPNLRPVGPEGVPLRASVPRATEPTVGHVVITGPSMPKMEARGRASQTGRVCRCRSTSTGPFLVSGSESRWTRRRASRAWTRARLCRSPSRRMTSCRLGGRPRCRPISRIRSFDRRAPLWRASGPGSEGGARNGVLRLFADGAAPGRAASILPRRLALGVPPHGTLRRIDGRRCHARRRFST